MRIVYENGSGEIVEKKSRFIANIFSINNEEEAVKIINETKKKYWDARHNCYAYVCGEENQIQKFSDDGEPSGTAGKPIMDIIVREEIRNCLIIVTRYFGGTLLGTGGLIRAYQGAAKESVQNAVIMEAIKGIRAGLDIDYNNVGKIQYICAQMDINIAETAYTEKVHMEILMNADLYVHFVQRITDEFNGKIIVEKLKNQNFCKNNEKIIEIN